VRCTRARHERGEGGPFACLFITALFVWWFGYARNQDPLGFTRYVQTRVLPGYKHPLEEPGTTGAGLTGVGDPAICKARGGLLAIDERQSKAKGGPDPSQNPGKGRVYRMEKGPGRGHHGFPGLSPPPLIHAVGQPDPARTMNTRRADRAIVTKKVPGPGRAPPPGLKAPHQVRHACSPFSGQLGPQEQGGAHRETRTTGRPV
jgi:hypothetical protein